MGNIFGIPYFVIILAVAILYVFGLYNSLVKMKVKIKEAWSQIDIQLKRRIDLIPNIIETVKGYASHEKEVFQKVTEARSALMSAKTPDQAGQANNMLTGALKSLFAVAEAYPELKAQTNFSQLQEQLADTEDKVAYSRQFYNATVKDFNTAIVTFPNNILAGMLGFKQEVFFEATAEERATPKVSF